MLKDNLYPFTAVVGQEEAKKALLIALVNRRAGGLLIGGAKGTAKSVLARSVQSLIGAQRMLTLPLNVTEDMLFGSIDLEAAVSLGENAFHREFWHVLRITFFILMKLICCVRSC